MAVQPRYVLGDHDAEIARLDQQAAAIAEPTRVLLGAAGLRPGMRVLDLGTGLGHVALMAAELVGPEGSVVGLDQSADLLRVAEERRRAAGAEHVRFVPGDVRTWRDGEFDAVVGRLILFHLPDAVDVVRHHAGALRPGGLAAFVDFDSGSARCEPPVELVTRMGAYITAAFRSAGADPAIGPRLGVILGEAGLIQVRSFGIQAYVPPGDPRGVQFLTGVVRSLAPQMERAGIATAEDLGLDTLAERLGAALREAGAVFLPPAVAGAWGRRAP
jgi:ubiquinone/menaquinone biosynthesis C-methylase UbiE